jgi:hypothetical protein
MRKIIFVLLFLFSSFNIFSQSLHLTQSRQWINLGDLNVTGDKISIEAKITLDNPLAFNPGIALNIVSKHTNPNDVNYLLRPWQFILNCGGKSYGLSIKNYYNLFKSYHIAGTYDGTIIKLFINGCEVSNQPASGSLMQNDLPTAIGQISSNNNPEQFYGYIEEVRIWNVARTEDEIKANMNDLPNPTQQPGLVAYYKFDSLNPYINLQGDSTWNGIPVGNPQIIDNPYDTQLKPFAIDSIGINYENISEVMKGKIIVHASGGSKDYKYSLDNINFQTDSIFSNLSQGLIRVFASDAGCTLSDSVFINPPQILIVFIPDTSSEVGVENFPIYIKLLNKNKTSFPKIDFLCEIAYDVTAFLPNDNSSNPCIIKDTIINQNKVLTIKGENISINDNENILAEILGTVFLADSDITNIYFNSFSCSDTNIIIKTKDGSLTITACVLPLRRVKLFNQTTLTMLPNPASESVNIKVFSEEEGNFIIKIFNLQGSLIETRSWNHKKSETKNILIDLNNYSSGLYQVVFQSPSDRFVKPLIIIK